jgi:hypothetical protein
VVKRALAFMALALWLAWVAGASAQPPAAAGRLTIQAPAQLTLASDRETTIEYTAPDASAARLHVNVGTLGTPVRVGPDRWRALYQPPPEKYPQVAIVVLIAADGREFAWSRIALLGSAKIAVRSEPSVEVTVRVESASFGPVRTDLRGKAEIPVVIPPGVTRAVSIASDALGNRTEQMTPVDVPAFGRLLSVCAPGRADAFWVFAVDARGEPLKHAPLVIEAARLRVGKTVPLKAGAYRVQLAVPTDVRTGEVIPLRARLRDDTAHVSTCELNVPSARLEGVAVSTTPAAVVAAEQIEVQVRVEPRYVAGAEAQSVDIQLEVDLGQLSRSLVRTSQPVDLRWTLPASFAGKTHATITAHAGTLASRTKIELKAGPVDELVLALEDPELRADGKSRTTLRVIARDTHGNPVSHAKLMATSSGGQLGALASKGGGVYEASYRVPGPTHPPEVIEVSDPATGVRERLAVPLGRAERSVFLGARGGYLTNFARVAGPLVVAQVGLRLPLSSVKIDVGIDGGWYSSKHTDEHSLGRIETSLSAVPLLARADYVFELSAWELRAFAGPGVLLTSAEVASVLSGSQRSNHVGLLLAGGGGMGREVGPGRLVLELAYWHAPVSTAQVSGNAGGATASLGYLAEL